MPLYALFSIIWGTGVLFSGGYGTIVEFDVEPMLMFCGIELVLSVWA